MNDLREQMRQVLEKPFEWHQGELSEILDKLENLFPPQLTEEEIANIIIFELESGGWNLMSTYLNSGDVKHLAQALIGKCGSKEQCGWTRESEDSDTWATGCGEYFTINEGTPKDNQMKFCCYCGKEIIAAPTFSGEKDKNIESIAYKSPEQLLNMGFKPPTEQKEYCECKEPQSNKIADYIYCMVCRKPIPAEKKHDNYNIKKRN